MNRVACVRADVFVKAYLMCKKKVVQRKKTSLKAVEAGPVWNEVIIFHLEHGVEVRSAHRTL